MHRKLFKLAPVILVLPALLMVIKTLQVLQNGYGEDGDLGGGSMPALALAKSFVEPVDRGAWSIFRHFGDDPGKGDDRYRLAGTFFLMADPDSSERKRLAIIDDISDNRQYIVSEGQAFQEHDVLRIYKDKLILRKGVEETVLTLSYASVENENTNRAEMIASGAAEEQYPVTRYGRQIGGSRWVLQKEALMDYYRELLDNPERIAALYLSLKPDQIDEKVAGYRVEREGEAAFFDAMGLKNGDVIRTVNSMKMTSQNRAEYFLSEFVQDRLGAVILDIEREGTEQKMIYLLR